MGRAICAVESVRLYDARVINWPVPFLAAEAPEGSLVALAVVAAAAAGALIAGLTRFPKPAGYLVGGILLGPGGFGLVDDREQIEVAAEIGVALLLFSVGLELSLRELARNLRWALVIGLGQALFVGVVVYAGTVALDVPATGALVLAGAAGLSSTAAGVALISGPSGRLASLATVAIGVLIVQDILAIVIIATVPAVSAGETDVLLTALLNLGLALAAILAIIPVAAGISGVVMQGLARRVDRELFLVATLAAVGGAAAGAALLGLSPAVGAFVAGLLIRQSGFGEQALLETGSLRDVFAAIFFVSVGLLFRPSIIMDEPQLVVMLIIGAVAMKFMAIAMLARYSQLPWAAALTLGVVLANAGEFSFVVVDVADPTVLSEEQVSALVFTVVFSVLLSSLVAGLGDWSSRLRTKIPEGAIAIVGYGRVGRALALAIRDEAEIVIVDRNAAEAALAQADGLPAIWSDVMHAGVISRLRKPKAIVVTPAGVAGVSIVEALARGPAAAAKIISLSSPPKPGSLGLDLAVVDADRRVVTDIKHVIDASLGSPFESPVLRSRTGVVRYLPPQRPEPPGATRRLIRFFSWAGPQPGECKECSGRGRRFSWPVTTTCKVCAGSGRAR